MQHNFNNIPQELQLLNQWIVWGYRDKGGKKPTKVPYNSVNGKPADVTDPTTWGSFQQAVYYVENNPALADGIGMVFTDNDPYAFIDFDAPDENEKEPQKVIDRQVELLNEFDSYAERSPSGNGLHIIVRGKILSGRRRSSIEIYSNERYATFTGDVFNNKPIAERNELLNLLYKRMGEGRNNTNGTGFYANAPETMEDAKIIEIASNAANGEKFHDLHTGNWQSYYQSQSEADFAYVDIIAYYTQNRNQITRIFRTSSLGQRDKAQRDDYVNYMLNRCFDRMLPPVDIEGLRNQLNEAIARLKQEEELKSEAYRPSTPVQLPEISHEFQQVAEDNPYTVPPGLVGEVAKYIYAQSIRPVPEISLAAAISMVAGIVGRSYNISGTGLNQYMLLLAPTGTGKEAMAGGIDKLMNEIVKVVPAASDFRGPGKIASQQALIKYMDKSPSFLTIIGEFGLELQAMASPYAQEHKKLLMALLMDLYNKSGEGQILRPSIFSDKDKNTGTVKSPGLSMLGESTPETFYAALNELMITSGLLPRFMMIEYRGPRPPINKNHISAKPGYELVQGMAQLCAHSLMLNSQNKAINVAMVPEAEMVMDAFELLCTKRINEVDAEVQRHLWNRAHVKALKLAALIATGNNPYKPEICVATANWAINIVRAEVNSMLSRFDAGEIGNDNEESKQIRELCRIIKTYLFSPWHIVESSAKGYEYLHMEKVIVYSYLQKRCSRLAVFKKDKIGETRALQRALQVLCDRGDLIKMEPHTVQKDYGKRVVAYVVQNMSIFEA